MTNDDFNKLSAQLTRLGFAGQFWGQDNGTGDVEFHWAEGVTPPTQEEIDATPSFPIVRSVTATQGLLVLDNHGWYDQVATIVQSYPRRAMIWYTRAQTWEWGNPYLEGIAVELGLDDNTLDALFYAASQIEE